MSEDTICKTHPDAPHGFCRDASLLEDRYVCECEFWTPPIDEIESLHKQIECYEQALKASWPDGAMGDAFDYWNAARKMQGDKL